MTIKKTNIQTGTVYLSQISHLSSKTLELSGKRKLAELVCETHAIQYFLISLMPVKNLGSRKL